MQQGAPMKTRSRAAPCAAARRAPVVATLVGMLAAAGLVGCGTQAAVPAGTHVSVASPSDPRTLAIELNARLDALQRQSEPASDAVIDSLERALHEQREKRSRTSATAASAPAAAVPATPAATVAKLAPPPLPPTALAAHAAPLRSTRVARAAKNAPVSPSASAAPPNLRAANPADPALASTASAHATPGAKRAPLPGASESRLSVDELYESARALELQAQTAQAIALYRDASQRGHAASSQRLMELYADGAPGVARDYRVAVFYKERAVQQGVAFEPLWRH